MNRQFVVMAGYSSEELERMGDLSQKPVEEIQELIRRKSMESLGLNGNGKQKIVSMNDVRTWILRGWEYVNELPNGEVIIRLPTG